MKPKAIKICANKYCNNTFRPYKTTDKYCSYSCALENKKPRNPQKQISKVSKKKQALDRLYKILRFKFMTKPENKYCAVYPNLLSTEVHHKAGRIGKLYLYVPYWLAVSSEGHKYIHDNPKESYKRGWLIKSTTV